MADGSFVPIDHQPLTINHQPSGRVLEEISHMATGKINTQKFKKRLLEERDRLEAQMRRVEAGDEESQADEVGELSHYDEHTADSATETFQRERDLAIGDNLKL